VPTQHCAFAGDGWKERQRENVCSRLWRRSSAMSFNSLRNVRLGITIVAGSLALGAMTLPTHAGVVALNFGAQVSGWQASWDASLDGLVDIHVNLVNADTIFIEKSAQFTQGPVNGIFPTIPIVFQQVGASNITHIVIDDEIITNQTGS